MLGLNSSTSRWVDLEEMALAQDIEITDKNRKPVTDTFLKNMEQYKKKEGSHAGMVWRWAVGSNWVDNRAYLKVQALPCNLAAVKGDAILRHDNTMGIEVARFTINYAQFSNMPGPIPIIFSEDPKATAEELKKTPQLAFDHMQLLMSRLVETEPLTKEKAKAYLTSPTLGKTRTPLVRTWESVKPASKVPTTPKTTKQDKGNTHIYIHLPNTCGTKLAHIHTNTLNVQARR